ncbi:MAG TPA: FtsX-like permease family protein [Bryobacteraceae bacterium]|nr:FtsX-like permease family protein [Bryobacteraceae bacterium]
MREIFVPSMLTLSIRLLLVEDKGIGVVLQHGRGQVLGSAFVHHNHRRPDANFPAVGSVQYRTALSFVSVTERTREIGLRMALGARRVHVLLQFLTEAVLLSVVGAVAGIIGGLIASEAISLVAGWPTPIVWSAIAGGFFFSALVGMFFGYCPARKAAHFDPIEALRFE